MLRHWLFVNEADPSLDELGKLGGVHNTQVVSGQQDAAIHKAQEKYRSLEGWLAIPVEPYWPGGFGEIPTHGKYKVVVGGRGFRCVNGLWLPMSDDT